MAGACWAVWRLSGVLRAALGRRGGSAMAGSWRGGESAGGRVLHAMSGWHGGRWWLLARALHAVLKRRGRSAGSCAMWQGDMAGSRCAVGGGWALRFALSGVAGQRGVARHLGVAWWWVGGQGLACRVGAAQQVGRGRVLGQGRMEVVRMHKGAAMACNAQGLACHVRAAWRVGSGGVLGQGRMEVTCVHEGGDNGLQCQVL
ncbi:hypothetical protein EDB84DRAFT_1441754 [Lactarius hengduanensis]|nr:hypothetical protein EDB84DRAFT_1441754 [Lactarius hengduanensis]